MNVVGAHDNIQRHDGFGFSPLRIALPYMGRFDVANAAHPEPSTYRYDILYFARINLI